MCITNSGVHNRFLKMVSTAVFLRGIEKDGVEGPIDRIKTPDDVPANPYKLPTGFAWTDIDIFDEQDVGAFAVVFRLDK